jgi:signal transduction histidine kinase
LPLIVAAIGLAETAVPGLEKRILRDLHDGPQQSLVVAMIDLQLAEADFDSDPEAARSLLHEAFERVREGAEELRAIVRGGAPARLAAEGLGPAVETLVQTTPIEVDADITGDRLPREVEEAAYYLIREAVANTLKHADATRVAIRVVNRGSTLEIEVSDDGRGGAGMTPGGGLAGLQDRVAGFGGKVAVVSPLGKGTHIRATLTLPLA